MKGSLVGLVLVKMGECVDPYVHVLLLCALPMYLRKLHVFFFSVLLLPLPCTSCARTFTLMKVDSSAKAKYSNDELIAWAQAADAKDGDLVCIFAGAAGKMADKTREVCGKWRHVMGTELGYRSEGFNALWVVNFPLLEWDPDEGR